MGIIWELIKLLGETPSPKDKEKERKEKEFNELADYLGMTKDEKEDCKLSGITPEEWAEKNDPNYEDD